MSLHPSNSAPAISGLGISFLPSPTPPSPPQHSSHSHYGHREQPQGQRYDEFEPKQQSHAQRHPQEGAYPAGLGRAGHVQGGRARAASVQMARIVSQDSTGLSDKRIRIASGEPGAYGGMAYEHKDNEGHRHELSPLSDFDTGSSSDEHSFSPASMSSLPSSTNSGAAYYPQYHAAQAPRHLRHAQSMGSLPQIADMLARIPLPQPPRPSTLSVQHTDDELDLPLLSPNSRLPAFLRDRTLQRHSLARPKSMMELGAVYAHVPIAEEPQSGYDGLAEDEVTEQQHDYGTYGGIYSPDSIASSAGGHARRQAEARLQETTAPTRLEVRGHTRSTSDYTYHGSPSDLPYAHPAPELPPTTILRPIARRPVDSPQRPVERVQERRAEAPPALPTERSTPLRHAVVTRPVVERAVEGAASSNLSRHATLLTVGAHPARRGQELDRLLAPSSAKRLSTGASLGSPTPSTGMPALARHVRSVSMASQQPSLHTIMSPVILEQTKSTSKARVELDLVLQSSLIVEGGKMKGKVELRVRKAKDEEQDVWIGRPKIRIVGFEELSVVEVRHIFYHHASSISTDEPLPCFEPTADHEGFYKGKPGQHTVPFDMLLPIGKGAKGGWKGKQGVVRYIVIVSVKLKSTNGEDRSIAHFYRHVEIFPYLNPAIVLAPALKPLSASVSKSLFMGGSGKVQLTASMHRSNWVAGQRCYVDVRVENESSKKVKTLTLTLVRTTTIIRPRPYQSDSAEVDHELDASQTQTTKKKMAEAALEMGKKGNSGVTAKGSWMGVDKDEAAEFSHSLLIPSEAMSIVRGRHLEVTYSIKVSVAGSLSADVTAEIPINVINFVSIDPPPGHCGEPTPANSPRTRPVAKVWSIDNLRAPKGRAETVQRQSRPITITKMASLDSLRLANAEGGQTLSRMGSLDTLRTSNLSQASTSIDRVPGHASAQAPVRGTVVVAKARERSLQHQMSLDCISSAIASATARRGTGTGTGHRRTESGLRSQIEREDENGERWDEGDEPQEEAPFEYYGGGGEKSYALGSSVYGHPDEMDGGEGLQLDDLDDDADEHSASDYDQRGSGSELDLAAESEDELEAVMGQSSFNNEADPTPFETSINAALYPPLPRPPQASPSRASIVPRVAPSSPTKSAYSSDSSMTSARPAMPKSAMKQRTDGFGFATPASPIKANAPPVTTARSLAARPIVANAAPRPSVSIVTASRVLVAKKSMSSLRRAPEIPKKSSMRSLRPAASMVDLRRPSLANVSPRVESSSNASTPELDSDRSPTFARLPTSNVVRVASRVDHPRPTVVRATSRADYSRPTASFAQHTRAPVAAVLPSVRAKVQSLEVRAEALARLRSTDGPSEPVSSPRRADSVASRASFRMDELSRADSIMSFKAPLLKRHA